MGSELSCFSSGKMNTYLESKGEGIFTDDEQTEFQAHAVNWISLNTAENATKPNLCKNSASSLPATGESTPSPCKTEIEAKRKVRIYSSNASKNCFNLIETGHSLGSKCSTRFNSRNNSRCVSPKFHNNAMLIE